MEFFLPCDSAARSVGAEETAEALREVLAGRGLAHPVRRTGSRGLFWLEPLLEVDRGDGVGRIAFGPVVAADVPSVLEAVLTGDILHPLFLGATEEIAFLKRQQRLTFARVGVIEPLDLDAYIAHGGMQGARAALTRDPEAICAAVEQSGLRGRGGAGFPAGIKWNTVRAQDAARKFVVCNADEGDSGTFADRMLMEGDPFLILEGMIIAALATGAREGLVYIRSEYPDAITRMGEAVEVLREAGWLGPDIAGSGRAFDIAIRRGAGAYICGEESAMLNSLEGRRGVVRAKPPIPAVAGLFGQPTLVHNVLTLAAAPTILARGAAFYRDFGAGRSRGTQAFQLAGNVRHGGLVETAFGVTLRDLIERFGGGTATGRPFRAAQLGGPLGAYVDVAMLDLPMDYETLAEAGAMLGHGGIVVFDDTVDMAAMARFAFAFCAEESCGKCTPCRVGAVRGKETVERVLRGENVAANLALIEDLCTVMRDGSLCAMGGLTPAPVLSAMRLFPEDFTRLARVAAE